MIEADAAGGERSALARRSQILFRCDASRLIGSGHVMRCRTLARELKRQGQEVAFICRRLPGDLSGLLNQEFEVMVLPPPREEEQDTLMQEAPAKRRQYANWLGVSQWQDATECLAALEQQKQASISWIVVDHYGLDRSWQREMLMGLKGSSADTRLLVVDDLADRHHLADILLDQNRSGNHGARRYRELCPEKCQMLLGPHHALLGEEYARWQQCVPHRRHLGRILIYFGGGETSKLTADTITALNRPSCHHLHLDVVHHLSADPQGLVMEAATQRPFTTVHQPLPSLAGLIARADLAVGAAGSTTWERACLGLPSLLLVLDENQAMVAEEAVERGAALCLGREWDGERLVQCILDELPSMLEVMSRACQELCDGQGVSRMIQAMEQCGQTFDG